MSVHVWTAVIDKLADKIRFRSLHSQGHATAPTSLVPAASAPQARLTQGEAQELQVLDATAPTSLVPAAGAHQAPDARRGPGAAGAGRLHPARDRASVSAGNSRRQSRFLIDELYPVGGVISRVKEHP